MKGDLLVSIYRNGSGDDYSFGNEGDYYSDINYEIVNYTNTNLKNGRGEIIIVNEAYFLGIY